MKKIVFIIIAYISFIFSVSAQQAGDTIPFIIEDNTFFFTPSRPLITDDKTEMLYKNVAGIDLLFSNSGFGFGLFYDKSINKKYKIISEIYFSSVKNSDELEYLFDYNRYEYIVLNKVRRLYVIPFSVGVQRYFDIGPLSKTFRPYVAIVATPSLIWEMPYQLDWFRDVKHSKAHYRIGGGMQVGMDFGDVNTTFTSFKMRYIYTPFGNGGLESVIGSPINNFGRFYVSLSIGGLF